MSCIYLVTNRATGLRYVGQTSSSLDERWLRHCSAASNGSSLYFHRALRKYGQDAFDRTVLEECSECDLNDREQYWILTLDTRTHGYNLTDGGDGVRGFKHTLEARAKMSAAHKGKLLPSDVRKKISESHRGRKKSPEHIQRLRESHRGKHDHRGENHPQATVTSVQVLQIREIWEREKLKSPPDSRMINVRKVLCRQFGISRAALIGIVTYKSWTHLKGDTDSE